MRLDWTMLHLLFFSSRDHVTMISKKYTTVFCLIKIKMQARTSHPFMGWLVLVLPQYQYDISNKQYYLIIKSKLVDFKRKTATQLEASRPPSNNLGEKRSKSRNLISFYLIIFDHRSSRPRIRSFLFCN